MSDPALGSVSGGPLGGPQPVTDDDLSESDLPEVQGLDRDVSDPTDPQAERGQESVLSRMSDASDEPSSGSDPMPDMAGTSD